MPRPLLNSLLVLTCVVLLCPQIARAQFSETYLGKTRQQWQAQLNSTEPRERRTAAFALGSLGSKASGNLRELMQLLNTDKSARVREAAAFAIGNISKGSLAYTNIADLNPTLEDKLARDPDALVRRSCAYALGCQGKNARNSMEALDRALNDKSLAVRQNAAWALGQIGMDAVTSLRKALRDNTDASVIRDAAGGLASLGADARPAVQDLVDRCNHPNVEAQKAVLSALVAVLNEKDRAYAAGPLQKALRDDNDEVRLHAAFALSNIGGEPAKQAIPALTECMSPLKDLDLRRQAAAAFRNIGPEAITALPDLRRIALDKDEDLELRYNAIVSMGGLGNQGGAQAVPTLVEILSDRKDDRAIRQKAGESLTDIGSNPTTEGTIPRLVQMLDDPNDDARVRWKAIWSLKTHGKKLGEHPDLLKALNNIVANEKKSDYNKMLRYDCSILLGVFEEGDVKKAVLDNLLDFLQDKTIQIYTGVQTDVRTKIGEANTPGQAKVKILSASDGRVQAITALEWIGAARVKTRPDVIAALRALLNGGTQDKNLQMRTKKLLNDFGL